MTDKQKNSNFCFPDEELPDSLEYTQLQRLK